MFNIQTIRCALGFHGTMDVKEQYGYVVRLSHQIRETVTDPKKKTKVKEVVVTAQYVNCHHMTKTCKHCPKVEHRMVEIPGRHSSITVSMGIWERYPDEGLYFNPTHDNPFVLTTLGQKHRKK